MGAVFAPDANGGRSLSPRKPVPGGPVLDFEQTLDGRLDVELLDDVRSLPISSRAQLGSSPRAASADSQT